METLRDTSGFRRRLRGARRMRGFSSIAKAGAAIGLPGGSYSIHEAGTGTVTPQLVARLAHAFGVSEAFLTTGTPEVPADVRAARFADLDDAAFRSLMRTERAEVGRRLRAIRTMAGFRTGSEAATRFGWPVSTLAGHERGARLVSADEARIYAFAFGVPTAFLYMDAPDFAGLFQNPLPSADEVREFSEELRKKSRPPEILWIPLHDTVEALHAAVDPSLAPSPGRTEQLAVTRAVLAPHATVPGDELVAFRCRSGRSPSVIDLLLHRSGTPAKDGPRVVLRVVDGLPSATLAVGGGDPADARVSLAVIALIAGPELLRELGGPVLEG